MQPKMQEADERRQPPDSDPFNTMGDIKDPKYLDGIWMNYKGDNQTVERAVRTTPGAMRIVFARPITTRSTWRIWRSS